MHNQLEKSNFLHIFGKRLSEARARLGLTQAELADRVGIARRTQINYERGERAPDVAYLNSLVAEGVAIQQLFHEIGGLIGREDHLVGEPQYSFDYAFPSMNIVREAMVTVLSALDDSPLARPSAERVAEAVLALASVSRSSAEIEANKDSILRLLRS